MAAKENQGLQAIVITLVVFLLIAVVGLVFVNNARKAAVTRADAAASSEQAQLNAASEAQREANDYKTAMGFAEGDSKQAMDAAIAADMAAYGADMQENERSYRTLIETLFTERNRLTTSLNEATIRENQLQQRLTAVQNEAQAQIDAYKSQLDTALAGFAAAKTEFKTTTDQLEANNKTLQDQLSQLQQERDEQVAGLNAEKQQMSETVAQVERSLDLVKSQVPDPDPFAEPADARITWVNQRYAKAWLDIGSADGLRPQVTFSVFAKDNNDAVDAEKKASIEVVRIWGPHLAEARIIDSDITDPIMPGDQAYSQVWDRGRVVGFAVAGYIDIDGDGSSDMDLLRDIIAASGGRIDLAPDAEGNEEGEIQVDTRFLILGERSQDPRHSGYLVSWNTISEKADTFGVPPIGLADFLRLMGWKNDARSVGLGESAQGRDFPPLPSDNEVTAPSGTPAAESPFKPRLPRTPY